MIRLVTAFFVFAVGLCAYIIYAPMMGKSASPDPLGAEVTRAVTLPDLAPASEPEAAETAPATAAPGTQDLGSMIAPDMGSRILAASGGTPARTAPTIQTDSSTIEETAAAVLAGLGLQTGAPAPDGGMLDMTSTALSGIMAATGKAGSPAAPRTALQDLVVEALKSGETDAGIDTLLNAAAQAGEVAVPEILVTANGRVDTAVLLASIISQAQIANGGAAPAVPATPTGSQDGVEVRIVQKATDSEQFRFYTVSQGDSLGSIAIKFYGDAGRYPAIFEANRQFLSSPDQIRTGQRLVIPDL